MFYLRLLRHGQATHNLAEQQGLSTMSLEKYFDPDLTELGISQCSPPPKLPQELNATPPVVWCSPLRRCLQTALESLKSERHIPPENWRLVDCIREIAGQKPADARRSKKEILEWLGASTEVLQLGKIRSIGWNSHITDDQSLLPEFGRETGIDLMIRVARSIELMLKEGDRNLIIVSHSAFLSCLLAILDENDDPERRWLANGEWRSVTLSPEELNSKLENIKVRLNRVGVATDPLPELPLAMLNLPPKLVDANESGNSFCPIHFETGIDDLINHLPTNAHLVVAQWPLPIRGAPLSSDQLALSLKVTGICQHLGKYRVVNAAKRLSMSRYSQPEGSPISADFCHSVKLGVQCNGHVILLTTTEHNDPVKTIRCALVDLIAGLFPQSVHILLTK